MILAHKTRIRTANPGSAIANALAQHDGAARWAYNNLLASLKDGIESSSGGLWPSVGGLTKTLRREKPEWWASVDWEMLDNGGYAGHGLETLATVQDRQARLAQARNLRVPPIPQTWRPEGDNVQQPRRRRQAGEVAGQSPPGVARHRNYHAGRSPARSRLAERSPRRAGGREVVRRTVYENGRQLPDASGDGAVVGVDVGIKTLAVTSDGQEHGNPRCYQRGERKLRRINKAIARSIQLKPQPAHESTGATL